MHPLTAFDTDLLDDQVSMLGRLADTRRRCGRCSSGSCVVGTLLPFGVELAALRHLPATTVTMVAMLEPIGVAVLGWVWFYESLDAVALVGGVAVVSASCWRSRRAGPQCWSSLRISDRTRDPTGKGVRGVPPAPLAGSRDVTRRSAIPDGPSGPATATGRLIFRQNV